MPTIGRNEAQTLIGFDERMFRNFSDIALEFPPLPRRRHGRYYYDESGLRNWLVEYRNRIVNLSVEDYLICLDFALAIHLSDGDARADWGTGRQREFGQKISNWVRGLLGERALKKFLEEKFGITVVLDFNLYDHIVAQDIREVWSGDRVITPAFTVGVKSSKPKNSFLILSQSEVEIEERHCDAHVFCRVDLPDDHLLRICRDDIERRLDSLQHHNLQAGLHLNSYRNQLPTYAPIRCEIAGWCTTANLRPVMEIPGQNFENPNHVIESGLLNRSTACWEEFRDKLLTQV